jgi:diphthine synthase
MVLFFIGLGLGDEKDITVKGLEYVKSCEKIFLESYTSVLSVKKEKLEELYGKEVQVCYRETVEIEMDEILKEVAENQPDKNYAFLVVGDPFCATTHSDLFLRAVKLGIEVKTVHNASIMNAIGATGLQLYSFGETVSIPYYQPNWRPYSFLNKIAKNIENGFHTLVLLDIRVREISFENLAKGKEVYDPPRFMSCKEAVEQMIEAEENLKTGKFPMDLKMFGVARMGFDDQKIAAGTLEDFLSIDMGGPLHSMVVCAPGMHDLENEMFKFYCSKNGLSGGAGGEEVEEMTEN